MIYPDDAIWDSASNVPFTTRHVVPCWGLLSRRLAAMEGLLELPCLERTAGNNENASQRA